MKKKGWKIIQLSRTMCMVGLGGGEMPEPSSSHLSGKEFTEKDGRKLWPILLTVLNFYSMTFQSHTFFLVFISPTVLSIPPSPELNTPKWNKLRSVTIQMWKEMCENTGSFSHRFWSNNHVLMHVCEESFLNVIKKIFKPKIFLHFHITFAAQETSYSQCVTQRLKPYLRGEKGNIRVWNW